MTRFQSAAAAALAALALAGAAGCAPTPTRQSTGEMVDDAALTARVKSALINEPGVKSTAINVETFRGTVSLSGFVDSTEMAQKAVTAAENVRGARQPGLDDRVLRTTPSGRGRGKTAPVHEAEATPDGA
jgi:osmotically-inducible protein OsmY